LNKGTIAMPADPYSEEGKQILSAHRRLGQAIGIEVGQFKRVGGQAVATIKEGDPRLQQVQEGRRDRINARIYWQKFAPDRQTYFESMSVGIRASIDMNGIYAFIGSDNQNQLDEKTKATLSAKRVLARAFGFKIGKFDLHHNSGTADAPLRKKLFPKVQIFFNRFGPPRPAK